jgi:pre-mRNA-processing factor 17
MPTTAAHPDTMSFVSVGLENRLFRFKVNNQGEVRKNGECAPDNFAVAGFACEPAYTPCGKHLACGDGNGSIHFLRTNTAFQSAPGYTAKRIIHAHAPNTAVSCVAFHPCIEGALVSVSWDGSMKMWAS